MFFESRERKRRNRARYTKVTNQKPSEKRMAPVIPNRSQPVKDSGAPVRRRNRHTYRPRNHAGLRLFALIFSAIFLFRLGHLLYGWLCG